MEREEKEKETIEIEAEKTGADEATEKNEMTLDELLANNKKYQSEYDKKVAQAMNTRLDNERKKWEEEQRTKLEEAEKLAKMDADEKRNYELEQWKIRAERAEKQNAIDNLRTETIKQASEKGISLDIVSTINFEYETAETIKGKLEVLEKAVKKEREVAISEYSKEIPPQTGDYKGMQKLESEMTYEELCNLPKYKN